MAVQECLDKKHVRNTFATTNGVFASSRKFHGSFTGVSRKISRNLCPLGENSITSGGCNRAFRTATPVRLEWTSPEFLQDSNNQQQQPSAAAAIESEGMIIVDEDEVQKATDGSDDDDDKAALLAGRNGDEGAASAKGSAHEPAEFYHPVWYESTWSCYDTVRCWWGGRMGRVWATL